MTRHDREALRAALEVLNTRGSDAAVFLAELLDRPENEEALAWIASIWEPVRVTSH